MAGHRSPYETLSVSSDAEPVVIEAAYKALIKKYHPDLWVHDPGAQDRAATINQAFAILRDPETRSRCDQQLRAMRNAAQAASFRHSRPRPSSGGLGWWSGWLVALLVAAAQWLPSDRSSLPPTQSASRSAPARVTGAATTQPETRKSGTQAKGPAGGERPLPDGLVELATKARERQTAFLASMDEPTAIAPARKDSAQPTRRPPARNKNPRRPRPPAENPAEAEFLEREGYIY